MDEFFELSALITQVQGLPGSLCLDCAMLGRPNASPNWAWLRRPLPGHLRFRLATPGSTAARPAVERPAAGAPVHNGAVTLAARVFAASYLTGTFVLRSGRTADHYFDKYRFESDPALLREIVEALVRWCRSDRGSRRTGARGVPWPPCCRR